MKHFSKPAILMVTTLLWMWSGCSTDDYQLTPGDGVELIQAYSSGGDREPDPDPETDCKCYMRVNSVENLLFSHPWGIIDETYPLPPSGPFEICGVANKYYPGQCSGMLADLPSDFRELNPPSNGWHSFIVSTPYPNFIINTEVRCYLQNGDGSEVLATTTYHQFSFENGILQPTGEWKFTPRQFSCTILSSGGTPKD